MCAQHFWGHDGNDNDIALLPLTGKLWIQGQYTRTNFASEMALSLWGKLKTICIAPCLGKIAQWKAEVTS